jgi:lipopolysaccharide/colanic/teichoic acid biosynthesis glycosyltransferase
MARKIENMSRIRIFLPKKRITVTNTVNKRTFTTLLSGAGLIITFVLMILVFLLRLFNFTSHGGRNQQLDYNKN